MPEEPMPIGAWREGNATRFRVWAPDHPSVDLVVERHAQRDVRPLARADRGYWGGRFEDVRSGDRYRYRLGGDDGRTFPDPASRYQPDGVHGASEVIDPATFQWTDHDWRPPRREELVIYELHVGTFAPQGTFRGVIERLPYLAQLGVSAIELMPVGDFPGDRNWGYDGVAIFAPARCYGTPDDLRALVNTAHQHGIAVMLDVVYNHFGPDGAYANAFSPYYFTDRHKSPWGQGVNMDGPHSADVRAFFIANARHWIDEYHIDGLRLDATHAIQDDGPHHFLEELTTTLREGARRPVTVIAEDHRNLVKLLLPPADEGWGLDGVWADDLHHQIRVHVAGDREGYYEDYTGSADDIATTIRRGWFFTGQPSKHMRAMRGSDPSVIDPRRFVVCIQNHDQVGNRFDGARLNHQVDAATFRAITTLVLLAPETPLIFQGQEWATRAPFLFFTDHHEELGRQVTSGRRQEFASFAAFADPALRARIPDPQAPETFARSRLPWQELQQPAHAAMLRLYQRLIGLRATATPLRTVDRDSFDARALDGETLLLLRRDSANQSANQRAGQSAEQIWIVVRLAGTGTVTVRDAGTVRTILTTEDADLTPDARPIAVTSHADHVEIRFDRPGAVIFQSSMTM
jgi:maltooligosyltrehalose trehalohydrolase